MSCSDRLAGVFPEPVREHYVVVEGRRFPLKQAMSLVTGLDRADFTSHQARRVLSRLGFTVARESTAPATSEGSGAAARGPHRGREADALRPYMGKWVAQRGLHVLVAMDSPQDVLAWLEHNDEHADMMFRVPTGPDESGGAAPA